MKPMTALLLLAVATPAWAQTGGSVSIGRTLTSFTGADAETRQGNSAEVMAEHKAANDTVRLFYTLDAGTFTTPGDWTYYLHNTGVTWHTAKDDKKPRRPMLFVGGSLSWRSNGESWSAVGYRAVNLFTNVEWKPKDTRTLRAGYRFDARGFPDTPELDQAEHTLFGSALLNFRTRTTLIGEVRLGFKSYAGTTAVADTASVPMVPATTTTTTAAGPVGGWGIGHGMGPSTRVSQGWNSIRWVGEPAASRHITFLARLAQSLANRTGLSFQYTRRITGGGLPEVLVTTPALFFDDGVYDDPFASDANTWRASLKHVTAGGTEFEATAYRTTRDYRAALALDAEGYETTELRADTIERAGLGMSFPLFAKRTGPVGLSLDVDYWYTRHKSNDAFYRYSSHVVGLGLTVSY